MRTNQSQCMLYAVSHQKSQVTFGVLMDHQGGKIRGEQMDTTPKRWHTEGIVASSPYK